MSFNDYVQHMTQKYKIAVALAVLQSKPNNLTIEEFCEKLKEKTKNKMDVDDVICDDDFNIDDDLFNDIIIDEFNKSFDEEMGAITEIQSDKDSIYLLQVFKDNNTNTKVEKNISNKPKSKEKGAVVANTEIPSTSKDCLEKCSKEKTENISIEVLKSLREIDENVNTEKERELLSKVMDNLSNTQSTFYDEIDENNKNTNKIDLTLVANVAKNINKVTFLKNNDGRIDTQRVIEENNEVSNGRLEISEDIEIDNIEKHINVITAHNVENEFVMDDNSHNRHLISEKRRKVMKNIDKGTISRIKEPIDNTFDTQETIIYTVPCNSQSETHISQSQPQNIEIGPQFIHGNKLNIDFEHSNLINTINEKEISNSNDLRNDSINVTNKSSIENEILKIDSSQIEYIIDKDGKTYAIFQKSQNYNENSNTTQLDRIETDLDLTATNSQDILDIKISSQDDIVPFKVIKELSKLKTHLKRQERRISVDGFSTDSGYKSDSTQQNSFKNALASDNWVQQSAHCLYSYLIDCPLVANTQEIVEEISMVLGSLVDKLHEEEKYPAFLEELLEKVEALLKDIYHGGANSEDILLEKDKKIQRLLLLNKSGQILKYTLDKVTSYLHNIHTHLRKEECLFELTNTQEIENICYIFSILEILLQNYIKFKNFLSQSTQNSQEKVLRKSSISDIWRKKWNLSSKEVAYRPSQEFCILKKCSEILNKIVVDCIEGYSLVAFAALQCFNMLQNQ